MKPGTLSRGLAFLWINIGGLSYDLVSNTYGIPSSIAALYAGPYGLQVDFGGISSQGIVFPSFNGLATDNGLGTGGVTLFSLSKVDPTQRNGYIISFGTYGVNGAAISLNTNTQTGADVGGAVSFNTFDNTNSFQFQAYTGGSAFDNTWHLFAGVMPPSGGVGTASIYIDGLAQSVTTSSVVHASLMTTAGAAVNTDAGSFYTQFQTSQVLAGAYNRQLSASENLALAIDPIGSLLTCAH